jgi:hypothetical protein
MNHFLKYFNTKLDLITSAAAIAGRRCEMKRSGAAEHLKSEQAACLVYSAFVFCMASESSSSSSALTSDVHDTSLDPKMRRQQRFLCYAARDKYAPHAPSSPHNLDGTMIHI